MNIDQAIEIITERQQELRPAALLVAFSGIDGSGKSTIAQQVRERLESRGLNAALIGLDAWHHLPEKRFNKDAPAEHFYQHAFRFDELFEILINPLRHNRSAHVTVELTRLPENDSYLHSYDFDEVDVIVLEGIFLFKKELRRKYDLAFWIECSFETALQRAIQRNQEGLSEEALIRDFRTIYFSAQRLHFTRDEPKSGVNGILENDELAIKPSPVTNAAV
jgi:uridine kinase